MTLVSGQGTSRKGERSHEKYAWVAFLPGLLFYLAIGLGHVLSPGTVEPTAPPTDVRLSGLGLTGLTVLGFATVAGGFRKGDKWAWYSLWYYPIFFVLIFVFNITDAYWTTNSSLFLVLSVVGLLVPYRRFFPKVS